jgi:hypothetical protein
VTSPTDISARNKNHTKGFFLLITQRSFSTHKEKKKRRKEIYLGTLEYFTTQSKKTFKALIKKRLKG